MDAMEYKGYTGSIEFSAEDGIYFGKIIGIRSLISYEGETTKRIIRGFSRSCRRLPLLCAKKMELCQKQHITEIK